MRSYLKWQIGVNRRYCKFLTYCAYGLAKSALQSAIAMDCPLKHGSGAKLHGKVSSRYDSRQSCPFGHLATISRHCQTKSTTETNAQSNRSMQASTF
jgi:hypothetical protein